MITMMMALNSRLVQEDEEELLFIVRSQNGTCDSLIVRETEDLWIGIADF